MECMPPAFVGLAAVLVEEAAGNRQLRRTIFLVRRCTSCSNRDPWRLWNEVERLQKRVKSRVSNRPVLRMFRLPRLARRSIPPARPWSHGYGRNCRRSSSRSFNHRRSVTVVRLPPASLVEFLDSPSCIQIVRDFYPGQDVELNWSTCRDAEILEIGLECHVKYSSSYNVGESPAKRENGRRCSPCAYDIVSRHVSCTFCAYSRNCVPIPIPVTSRSCPSARVLSPSTVVEGPSYGMP